MVQFFNLFGVEVQFVYGILCQNCWIDVIVEDFFCFFQEVLQYNGFNGYLGMVCEIQFWVF